jgi:hypothetical protein
VICRSDRAGTIQGFNSQLGMVLSALRRGNRIAPPRILAKVPKSSVA